MQFQPGISGNMEGRPKGSGNKSTLAARDLIQNLISDNASKAAAELNNLTGIEFLETYIKLLPYAIPKVKPMVDEEQNEAREKGLKVRQENARQNENNKRASLVIASMITQGKGFNEIARELNTAGYKTSRGKEFQAVTVKRLAERK